MWSVERIPGMTDRIVKEEISLEGWDRLVRKGGDEEGWGYEDSD